jgi:hypothetical protein
VDSSSQVATVSESIRSLTIPRPDGLSWLDECHRCGAERPALDRDQGMGSLAERGARCG